MNVGELKKVIADLPDEMTVVMSSDGEGNNYSPLSGHWRGHYVPESTWSGYLWSEEDERDFDPEIPDDAEVPPPTDAIEALVLWPTN